MSSSPNESSDGGRVSKVTFSPISSEILMVKIKTMNSEVKVDDLPKMTNLFQPISGSSTDPSENTNVSKSTESQKKASTSSHITQKEQNASASEIDNSHDSTPCLKHAAENISRKASDIPSEKFNMCNNCSKSMLSYIFLVQDFLDSLAKEITGNETPGCLQCARQEVRNTVAALTVKHEDARNSELNPQSHIECKSGRIGSREKEASERSKRRVGRHEKRRQVNTIRQMRYEDDQTDLANNSSERHQNQTEETNFSHDCLSSNTANGVKEYFSNDNHEEQSRSDNKTDQQQTDSYSFGEQLNETDYQNIKQQISDIDRVPSYQLQSLKEVSESQVESSPQCTSDDMQHFPHDQQSNRQSSDKVFRAPMERVQPNYNAVDPVGPNYTGLDDPNQLNVQSPTLYREIDGIVSTLSNAEREVYDSARDTAGWESLTEPQERLGVPPGNLIATEAFVTSCRNNAEAIGCLVVGTSLLLCRTSRTLCVLVSEGVSKAFRSALSTVFQVVQHVRSFDSLGTTKLALLEQPELGITFDKLNIWRLVQFTKCVYLNPDTLVIQNCDELFCRKELSAVPDIGWPDCFNSGVFVFSPSVHTFWHLLEFAEKQGSYDGGDQGLLNSYFNHWSSDINNKLSFIYNLMANVSYTYTPAFRQFGRDVKIVQFHGSFKPWHVKFFSSTGQISPASPVHPTYVQFVHIWINIFRITVLRLLSQTIQSYVASQETICALEILRFFPLPFESESEFYLSPPSVRLSLAEQKLRRRSSLPIAEAARRKSAEFLRYVSPEEKIPEDSTIKNVEEAGSNIHEESKSEVDASSKPVKRGLLEDSIPEVADIERENGIKKEHVKGKNTLPGAEMGDYHGMKAWEQGRMDYQGSDCSDNVIKRLEFLMSKSK